MARNILFIMYDQLRHDYPSCAGHKTLRTPHMDRLAATFLEALGAKIPEHILEGRSLMPLLRGESPDWREYDYARSIMAQKLGISPRDARLFMVADQRYTFTHAEGGFRPMLFDRATDPDELVDIGGHESSAKVLEMMYERLAKWSRRMAQRLTVCDGEILRAGKHDGILTGVYDESKIPTKAMEKYIGTAKPLPTKN